MNRSTLRDLERRLTDTPAGEPPEDLLARLRAEIPPHLDLAAGPPRRPARRLPPHWLRTAAMVVLALGGAWMLWRLSVPVLAPPAAVEEARGASVEEGRGAGIEEELGAGVEETRGAGIEEARDVEESRGAAEAEAPGPDPGEREQAVDAPAADRVLRDEAARAGGSDAPAVPEVAAGSGDRAAGAAPDATGSADTASLAETARVEPAMEAESSAAISAPAGAARRRSPPPPLPPAEAPLTSGVAADAAGPQDGSGRLAGAPGFADTADRPLSTFGLHVGTGSWELVRASLRRGHLPPPGVVRVEEVVNALDDGAPPPQPGEIFRLAAEGAPSPFAPGPDHRLLRFVIRARDPEPAGTAETVAEEARVEVEFDPRVVAAWRLLGAQDGDLEDRFHHDRSLHPGGFDAGEIGAGHAVTALYEVRLVGEPPPGRPLAHLKLRHRAPESDRVTVSERLLRVADLSPRWEEAPPSLRLAAVAAELAEQLRGSRWAEGTDPTELARQAAAVAAERPGDRRAAELADLAARVARLLAAR